MGRPGLDSVSGASAFAYLETGVSRGLLCAITGASKRRHSCRACAPRPLAPTNLAWSGTLIALWRKCRQPSRPIDAMLVMDPAMNGAGERIGQLTPPRHVSTLSFSTLSIVRHRQSRH